MCGLVVMSRKSVLCVGLYMRLICVFGGIYMIWLVWVGCLVWLVCVKEKKIYNLFGISKIMFCVW